MITVRTLRVAVPGGRDAWPEEASFGRLHVIASAVMEEPVSGPRRLAHDAQDKPWSVRPHRWEGDAELVLRAAWFDPSAAPVAIPDRLRLGQRLHPVLTSGTRDESVPVDHDEPGTPGHRARPVTGGAHHLVPARATASRALPGQI